VVAGAGQDRERFAALVSQLGLTDRVFLIGWVPHEHVASYLGAADVFVAPSRRGPDGWIEGQGLTPLEAMMMGTPVVATALGGLLDSVRHEETGLLVPPCAPEEVAASIERLFTSPSLRDKLTRNGHRLAVTLFSSEVVAERFSDTYTDLIGRVASQTGRTRGAPLDDGPSCVVCQAPTVRRYRARGAPQQLSPERVSCTTPHLAEYEDIWSCTSCGLGFQRPGPSPDELTTPYTEVVDELYLDQERWKRREFGELIDRIDRLRFPDPPGRLLEVGSYAGFFLDEAAKRGWAAVGLELSEWGAEHARTMHGVEVHSGRIEDTPWDAASFDVVCLWDVIEHLADPATSLKYLYDLVRPGGYLALTTPNMAGYPSKILRSRWPWLMSMHLFYFTPSSLEILFRNTGFEDISVGPHPRRVTVDYILQRTRRWAGPLGRAATRMLERSALADREITVHLDDLLFAVGHKPHEGSAAG
jgi:SAM-dependent methyltransferase